MVQGNYVPCKLIQISKRQIFMRMAQRKVFKKTLCAVIDKKKTLIGIEITTFM